MRVQHENYLHGGRRHFFASSAWAHDGVALEKDFCTIKAGPYAIHFSAYQRYGEEQEACDDIFKTGPTVFGLTSVESRRAICRLD